MDKRIVDVVKGMAEKYAVEFGLNKKSLNRKYQREAEALLQYQTVGEFLDGLDGHCRAMAEEAVKYRNSHGRGTGEKKADHAMRMVNSILLNKMRDDKIADSYVYLYDLFDADYKFVVQSSNSKTTLECRIKRNENSMEFDGLTPKELLVLQVIYSLMDKEHAVICDRILHYDISREELFRAVFRHDIDFAKADPNGFEMAMYNSLSKTVDSLHHKVCRLDGTVYYKTMGSQAVTVTCSHRPPPCSVKDGKKTYWMPMFLASCRPQDVKPKVHGTFVGEAPDANAGDRMRFYDSAIRSIAEREKQVVYIPDGMLDFGRMTTLSTSIYYIRLYLSFLIQCHKVKSRNIRYVTLRKMFGDFETKSVVGWMKYLVKKGFLASYSHTHSGVSWEIAGKGNGKQKPENGDDDKGKDDERKPEDPKEPEMPEELEELEEPGEDLPDLEDIKMAHHVMRCRKLSDAIRGRA